MLYCQSNNCKFTVPDEFVRLLFLRFADCCCSCDVFVATPGVVAGDGLLTDVLSLRLIPIMVGVDSVVAISIVEKLFFSISFYSLSLAMEVN
jgi:hypothetical protein